MLKRKYNYSNASKTSIFSELRKIVHIARQSNRIKATVMDLVEQHNSKCNILLNRRKFLQYSSVAAAGGAFFPMLSHAKAAPSIAIVGAGLAGLTTAYELRKSGIVADIYEASNRSGGRVLTMHNLLGAKRVTEIGGEFIDSNHEDIINLASELGLKLDDRKSDDNLKVAYFFDGKHYSEEQVVEAFKPLLEEIIAVYDGIEDDLDYQHEAGASKYDFMSLTEFLDQLKVSGWLREFIENAYVTEFGLDVDQQSCLNFVFMLVDGGEDELRENFQIFGSSDERYRIAGGASRITELLADKCKNQMSYEHELVSIGKKNQQYELGFLTASGKVVNTRADIVVLALPFSVLREVDIKVDLPPIKRKVIKELGYGLNTKLVVATKNRIWQKQGLTGEIFSSGPLQLTWDNSENQPGEQGGITFFFGGTKALEIAHQSLEQSMQSMWPVMDKAIPGFSKQGVSNPYLFSWANYQYSKGSYASYKVGQWTTIANSESLPVDRLFFAGEHCSYEHQGMMNGAVESGKATAKAILSKYAGAESKSG